MTASRAGQVHDDATTTAPEGVTVVRAADGTLVARKGPRRGDRSRLLHERRVLDRLDGLAVVSRQSSAGGPEGDWIDLVYVGPRTLASAGADLPAEQLLAALASVATTMNAAHERGVSHGRLDGDHVLLGADGQAVLCGWSEAGLRADPDHAQGSAEPAVGFPFEPTSDVAALGALAAALARRNQGVSGRVRTQLGAVATAAAHPDVAIRPPMGELARVLGAAAGPTGVGGGATRRKVRRWWPPHGDDVPPAELSIDLGLPAGAASAPGRAASPSSARVRIVVAAAAAVTAAAITVAVWPTPGAPDRAAPGDTTDLSTAADAAGVTGAADPAGFGEADITRSPAPATEQATPDPTSPAPPTTAGGLPPDAPATGSAAAPACPSSAEALILAGLPAACSTQVQLDGPNLRLGALAFALGAPADRAGLSDIACDGTLEATVLQVATGRVYVYDGWAAADQPTPARLVGSIAGATNLGDPTGSACGSIRVTLADGSEVALPGEHGV